MVYRAIELDWFLHGEEKLIKDQLTETELKKEIRAHTREIIENNVGGIGIVREPYGTWGAFENQGISPRFEIRKKLRKDGTILDHNDPTGEEWRRIKEHYRILASQKQVQRAETEFLAGGATKFKPDFTVERFVTVGDKEYKIFLNEYNEITVQENFGARNILTSFDDLAVYTKKKFVFIEKNTLYILDTERTAVDKIMLEDPFKGLINGEKKKKAIEVMEKYFDSIGKPITARWHVVSGKLGSMANINAVRGGQYKEYLNQKGVVVIDRAVNSAKAVSCIFKGRCS